LPNAKTIKNTFFSTFLTLSYKVKEVFYSIQGEAYHTGNATIFCRFSGCNLWSGREQDRAKAQCDFCDTDFVGTDGEGGGIFNNAAELVEHLISFWPTKSSQKIIVEFTGGEPLLQLDKELILECQSNNIYITVETNGTQVIPEGIDWVCVSPKANVKLSIQKADEIKIVYPQEGLNIKTYENFDAQYYYLQVLDDDNIDENRKKTIETCLSNPQWRMSVQIHKTLKIK
jgi:7-carboxy-7-deazaguanine synthase